MKTLWKDNILRSEVRSMPIALALIVSTMINAGNIYGQVLSLQTAYKSVSTIGQPHHIALSDLNKDGAPDVITGNGYGPNISVLFGTNSSPFLQTAMTLGDSLYMVTCVTAADINQDGWPDIIYGRYNSVEEATTSKVFVYLSLSNGTNFSKSLEYSYTKQPSSIVVFDVNNDTLNDIIVGHGHTLSIYIAQKKPGQFNAPLVIDVTLYSEYAEFQRIEPIDLNGDGKKDLLLNDGKKIHVLLATTPSPYFSPATAYAVPIQSGEFIGDIAIGDINNDGKNDLVALCSHIGDNASDSIGVFLGVGDGSILCANNKFPIGPHNLIPVRVVVCDLNNDDRLDVVVGDQSGSSGYIAMGMVGVLLHDSTPLGFTAGSPYVFGGSCQDLTVCDVNNDGQKDIIAVDVENSQLAVILAEKAPGDFSSIHYFEVPIIPWTLTTGDIDGNGFSDIIAAGYNMTDNLNRISIIPYMNSEDEFGTIGNLILWRSDDDPWASNIVATDINNDRLLDIANGYGQIPFVCVILAAQSPGVFNSYDLFRTSYFSSDDICIMDINQDEIPDIIIICEYLKGIGNGTFESSYPLFEGRFNYRFAMNDFNSDGKLDIAILDYDSLAVFLNQGNMQFKKLIIKSLNHFPNDMTSADLDHDGNPDIIIVFGDRSRIIGIHMALDSLGHFDAPLSLPVPSTEDVITANVADMNGDGILDIVTETYSEICVFTGLPSGGFSSPQLFPEGSGGRMIHIEDFDGDLRTYVCLANYTPNIIKYIKNSTPEQPAELMATARIHSPSINTPLYFSVGHSQRFGKMVLKECNGSSISISTHARVSPPYNFSSGKAIKRFYEITSDASTISGTISLPYDLSEVHNVGLHPDQLKLLRYYAGQWHLISSDINPANQTVSALTDTIDGVWTIGDPYVQSVPLEIESAGPKKFLLNQNYPNPFNPTTVINYECPVKSMVKLSVFDLLGQEVAVLVNEEKLAGRYSSTWNASGKASGVYFYRLATIDIVLTKKLLLLK